MAGKRGMGHRRAFNACECCAASTDLDLAVLDVMFPDGSGFQICKKIREKHCYPIIMLTAKSAASDKILGLTIGALFRGDNHSLTFAEIPEN